VLRTETSSSGEIVEDGSGNIRQQNSEQHAIVLAEIALDESEIFANGGASTHLSRVEVEVGSDAHIHDGVGDFVEVLRETLKLRPTLISKFRTGLSVAGLSPEVAPDLGPTTIDATLSSGEVAFAILRRYFGQMLAHEPGVRLGEDPEELHDMRVATRRPSARHHEDLTRLKSAQIGSYIYRVQDDQTFGNRSRTVTPANPCPVSSLGCR